MAMQRGRQHNELSEPERIGLIEAVYCFKIERIL